MTRGDLSPLCVFTLLCHVNYYHWFAPGYSIRERFVWCTCACVCLRRIRTVVLGCRATVLPTQCSALPWPSNQVIQPLTPLKCPPHIITCICSVAHLHSVPPVFNLLSGHISCHLPFEWCVTWPHTRLEKYLKQEGMLSKHTWMIKRC